MGLKERIESMSDEWLTGNPDWDDGYERARSQAAQLAQEADALMEEMVCVLDSASDGYDVAGRALQVLDKYKQYKEQAQ